MHTDLAAELGTMFAVAGLVAHFIEKLKRSEGYKWITPYTDAMTKGIAALIALLTTLGISTVFDATTGTLTVTGLPTTLGAAGALLMQAFSQYWMQKGYYLMAIKSNYQVAAITPKEMVPHMKRRATDPRPTESDLDETGHTPQRLPAILLVIGLSLSVGCASADGKLVLVEDRVHDGLTAVNEKVRSICTNAPLLDAPCRDVRGVLITALEAGASFNRAVADQKVSTVGPLVEAIGKLVTAVQKLPQAEVADLVRKLLDIVGVARHEVSR